MSNTDNHASRNNIFQIIKEHGRKSFLGALSMSIIWLLLMSKGYFAWPLLPVSFLGAGLNCFFTALILPSATLVGLIGLMIGVDFVLNLVSPFFQWVNFKPKTQSWPYSLRGTVQSTHVNESIKAALNDEFTYELAKMQEKVSHFSHGLSREPTNEELNSRGLMRCYHLQHEQMQFLKDVQEEKNQPKQKEMIKKRRTNFNFQLGVRYV